MRVLVLPEPGGARTWRIGDGEDTALRCAEFKPARIGSGALVSVVSGMVVVVIELCSRLLWVRGHVIHLHVYATQDESCYKACGILARFCLFNVLEALIHYGC